MHKLLILLPLLLKYEPPLAQEIVLFPFKLFQLLFPLQGHGLLVGKVLLVVRDTLILEELDGFFFVQDDEVVFSDVVIRLAVLALEVFE
jgi:hypothetical protein